MENNENGNDDYIDDGLPVREVYGSPENIDRLGAPSEYDELHVRYYFYPTWRSQFLQLLGFFASCLLCVFLSDKMPSTVIKGKLFYFFGEQLYLHLPLVTLLPLLVLGRMLINIYDSRYIIDDRGVEAQIGLFSLSLRQPRLRYEDIRGVEPVQTIWERLLGIGGVLIGSAMTQDVEIVMEGIADPRGVQLLIGGERDKRLKNLRLTGSLERTIVSGE